METPHDNELEISILTSEEAHGSADKNEAGNSPQSKEALLKKEFDGHFWILKKSLLTDSSETRRVLRVAVRPNLLQAFRKRIMELGFTVLNEAK